ncbi:MAG: ABC transporter ATP-binding protein/permease, partial [Pseudomonadota bacterium]|nr:ABC transporter ATP-binding protein/permease [Pseudomonadota bacterium]
PFGLLLMVGSAVAEGVGILMIVPLVAVALGGAQLPEELNALGTLIGERSNQERLFIAIALFLTAMTVRSIILYARDTFLAALQIGHETSLQIRAAATLADRGWAFASQIGQAGMQSLLLTDLNRAALAVHYGQQAAVAFVMLLVQFALTALLSPTMALIALTVILLAYGSSFHWMGKGRRSGTELSEAYEESTAAGFRVHAGLKAALAQGTVPQFLAEYQKALTQLVQRSTGISRDAARARAAAGVAAAIAASLLLFMGVQILRLEFALLVPLLILFARMSGPAQSLQQALQAASVAAPGFAAVEQRIGALSASVATRPKRLRPLEWDHLRLERVSYEHQPGLGLQEISLTLQAGEWLAISGQSGAGKTTLVDLIVGLIKPRSGEITVDGLELTGDRLGRWRESIAYVGQGELIFEDSIRGNLVMDGGGVDDKDLWDALVSVELAERVQSLPARLDQKVGDRGSSLSGGERQRLALARALLRRPRLLVLDEATSALDVAMEERVLHNIRSAPGRPAALLVAHRAITLDQCDRRVMVRESALVETV